MAWLSKASEQFLVELLMSLTIVTGVCGAIIGFVYLIEAVGLL